MYESIKTKYLLTIIHERKCWCVSYVFYLLCHSSPVNLFYCYNFIVSFQRIDWYL